MLLLQVVILLHLSSAISQLTFTTIPDTDDGPGYVFGNEGDENIGIFCEVINGGTQAVTSWLIMRSTDPSLVQPSFNTDGTVKNPSDLIGKITAIGSPMPDAPMITYRTNFTIVNFTSEFDNSVIKCGTAMDNVVFNVGFSIIPSLTLSVHIQTVIEGNDIMVNLSVPGAAPPFPPLLSSLWTHEGVPLSNANGITLDVFTITLSNVQRNQSGNYTLTVSNDAGSTTTSFILDVLFGVSGTSVGGDRLVVTGSTVTLVGYVNITGNPLPNVTWSGPDGFPRTTNDRFTLTDGQIKITDITNDDNGTYMCTISNGIGLPLVTSIQVTIAVPPGAPVNVNHMNVTDTTVTLSWSPPSQSGTPFFNYYHIMMTPSPPPDVTLNTTKTSFIVRGIIPNTMYNVSVRAVIADDRIRQLAGPSSQSVSFVTLVGAPMFEDVSIIASDGNILINWTFRHTGGQDIKDITVLCEANNDGSSQITYELMCSNTSECIDDNLMGSTGVGPVLAGVTYGCSVTAINSNGSDDRNITDITPTQGIPSAPELLGTIIGPGQVSFILRTSSSGDNETFQFRINITNNITEMTTSQSFIISNYVDKNNYTATVTLRDGGSFTLTIITSNRFGQSSIVITTPLLIIEPDPTANITSNTTTVSPSPSLIPSDNISQYLSVIIVLTIFVGISILVVSVLMSFIVCGNYMKRKESTTMSTGVMQELISVQNEAYGVHESPTDVMTNVAYCSCNQPSVVPAEYEEIKKPAEYETFMKLSDYEQINRPAEYETANKLTESEDYIRN